MATYTISNVDRNQTAETKNTAEVMVTSLQMHTRSTCSGSCPSNNKMNRVNQHRKHVDILGHVERRNNIFHKLTYLALLPSIRLMMKQQKC